MSVDTPEELRGLRAAGQVVAQTIRAMRRGVRPWNHDRRARRHRPPGVRARRRPLRSADRYGFPGTTCISVNDEAVHGIPGRRRMRLGDLVKLDLTAELDGFYADACRTVAVGGARPQALNLIRASEQALDAALKVVRAGVALNEIGAAVQRLVRARGFAVCDGLMGHGIGRRIHESPTCRTCSTPLTQPLPDGLVITIEPLVAAGGPAVGMGRDGWTVSTVDRSLAAHTEHTIVVRAGAPLILTA